jgi:serine/threonine protein kinase
MSTQQAGHAGNAKNGGRSKPPPYPLHPTDLLLVLRHIASALAFMHGEGFAHLDVKPANILVTYACSTRMADLDGEWRPELCALSGIPSVDAQVLVAATALRTDDAELRAQALASLHASGLTPTDLLTAADAAAVDVQALRRIMPVVFKLGDMGQAAPLGASDVMEGDAYYLSRELLNGDTSNLAASDVFSLGLTLLELATGRALPTGDEEYQALRDGVLPLHLLGALP